MATYDPMQSLMGNLQSAGLAAGQDASSGDLHRFLDPRFLSAIQTAMARSGQQDYGGKTAFDLLASSDQARSQNDPFGYANELLAGQGVQGISGSQELASANRALPGHEAGNWMGIQTLAPAMIGAIAGGAGGLYGGAPSAAAGGTSAFPGNATLMGMGNPISGAELTSLGFDPLMASLSAAPYAAPGAAAAPGATAPAAAPAAPAAAVPAAGASGAASGFGGLSSALTSPVAMGIGAGALLGGLGGSQQAGSITVEEGLPDWLMPYVKPQLDRYSTELQNYQTDPYGVMPSAMKEFQNTISGQYLDPSTNKYLEDYFRLGSERIKGSLSPSFGHMQAFGQHSGYNEALSRGLGDFATGLYGGNYAKERDRQTQMTAAAPSFLGQSSTAAFAPYQQYLQTVGSLGKKKDQPYFENPFGNVLGGAFLGGSLGGMFK